MKDRQFYVEQGQHFLRVEEPFLINMKRCVTRVVCLRKNDIVEVRLNEVHKEERVNGGAMR